MSQEQLDWDKFTIDRELGEGVWLSVRACNCLVRNHQPPIYTLAQLLTMTESELLQIKNFGKRTLNEIRACLAQKGLELKRE